MLRRNVVNRYFSLTDFLYDTADCIYASVVSSIKYWKLKKLHLQ